MLIYALSYEAAHNFVNGNPVISIQDHGYEESYKFNSKHILPLVFDDVTTYTVKVGLIHNFYKEEYNHREPIYFSENMARKAIKFTEKFKDIKDKSIIVHCWAGYSRSTALAFCLNQIFNLLKDYNPKDFNASLDKILHERAMPNPDVIKITMQTYLKCTGES